ncbi:transcriptional regulator GutM [Alkalihalobacillus deserti]|uniref:transcriptional regulator GutM n=1 Tax=Alkalihalobacillus deserti TaxID=2879466 RepID=UPI001D13A1FA|nr:transcriptional regulator GutM [Alkalihalobacillus deserti]
MFIYLIILVGIVWLVQSFLGFFQIKNFNKYFSFLRQKERVAIGRKRGLFKASTVILIAIVAVINGEDLFFHEWATQSIEFY